MPCTPIVTQQMVIIMKEEWSLLSTYCVPGTVLGAGSGCYWGSKPKRGATKNVFKTSCMQKESVNIRGQLLNLRFIMERVELGLLGGSGVSHFRPVCAVGFVAVTLFGLRFQRCFLRRA